MATILVVDDVAANREVLVNLLRNNGHRLVEAGNGQEGLDAVTAEHPDLVITDVLMPVMDGYELVRQLRLDPQVSATPVVFYTANYGEREARALAHSSGVAHVLTKPVESAEVIRVVHDVLDPGNPQNNAVHRGPLAKSFGREHLRLLTDKLSEKSTDLRATNARLRALINIGLELAAERDPDVLLQRVCESSRDLFGASYITLGIVDLDDRTVRHVVTCGTNASLWVEPGDAISGILGSVVRQRRTMRGDNPGGDPTAIELPDRHPPVHSFLMAPVASPDQVFGWICLVSNEGRSFSAEDEDLVVALSGQIGRIYETSHFFGIAQKRTKALEREVVERKRAESALRRERNRTQRYLDTAEVMLVALDRDGRITLVNQYACSILGWSSADLIGREWISTCVPERIRDTISTDFHELLAGQLSTYENLVLTRSGEERLVEWKNTLQRDEQMHVVGTFSSGTDITDRTLLEQQARHAQKMEAIGRLAGGVAHDFNNLLTAILGYCELIEVDLAPDDAHRADIEEIHKAGMSAAALTRQLLAFSRKEIIEPTLLDVNAVVTHTRGMLGRLIGENVEVIVRLAPDCGFVIADHGQIEQVIINLAVNARDAMPLGGTLTIETDDAELDEHYVATHVGATAGHYVALTVSDTGEGMSRDVQRRVFEPFYTTKGPGQGTGLGLATVHGIVARAGGTINVYSEEGKGTTFKVYFPWAPSSGPAVMPVRQPTASAGGESILVVEDAEGLRDLTRRLLEREGYAVRVAANAAEALRLFEDGATFNVLLSDVVMPGASGPELTRQLLERFPDLKVIYMSGYTEDSIVHHGVLNPGVAFLHKPFTAEVLGRKIREVLDR